MLARLMVLAGKAAASCKTRAEVLELFSKEQFLRITPHHMPSRLEGKNPRLRGSCNGGQLLKREKSKQLCAVQGNELEPGVNSHDTQKRD